MPTSPVNLKNALSVLVLLLNTAHVTAQDVSVTDYDDRSGWTDHFSHELTESLIAEGRRMMSAYQYAEAETVYARALQISRINNGLHHAGQITAIEHLLDSLLAQSKWDEFDQQLSYLKWLNETANKNEPDELVAGLTSISNWYRTAAASLNDPRSNWYLIHAKHLNWQAISLLERYFGPTDVRLAPLLYRVSMDHYYQAVSTQRRGMTSFEYKDDSKVPVNGWALSKNETVSASYRIGRENLLRIRSIYARNPSPSPIPDSLILVHLADWELVFENGESATAYYRQAYQGLADAGIQQEDIERFFNRPVVLPETHLRLNWPLWESSWDQLPLEYVAWSESYPGAQKPDDPIDTYKSRLETLRGQRATIHLNPAINSLQIVEQEYDPGRFNYIVSDMDVAANPEVRDSVLSWVYAELPLLKLRPRFKNGRLTVHDAFTLDYIFADGR